MGQVIIEHFVLFFIAAYVVLGALVLWTAKENREYIHGRIMRACELSEAFRKNNIGSAEAFLAGPRSILSVTLMWPLAIVVFVSMLWLIRSHEKQLNAVERAVETPYEKALDVMCELFADFEDGEVEWFKDFVSKVKPCFDFKDDTNNSRFEWTNVAPTVVNGALVLGTQTLSLSVSMALHREVLLSSAGEGDVTSLVIMRVVKGADHAEIVCKMREDSPVDGDEEAPEGRYRWMAYAIDSTFKDDENGDDFLWTAVLNPMLIALNGEDEIPPLSDFEDGDDASLKGGA